LVLAHEEVVAVLTLWIERHETSHRHHVLGIASMVHSSHLWHTHHGLHTEIQIHVLHKLLLVD
jgi:hypothetical protein